MGVRGLEEPHSTRSWHVNTSAVLAKLVERGTLPPGGAAPVKRFAEHFHTLELRVGAQTRTGPTG